MITLIKEYTFVGEGNAFKTLEAKKAFEDAKKKGKSIVGILHREVCNTDGKKIWEFLNTNDTLIGGTQNIVLNTYGNLDKANVTQITNMDSESGINPTSVTNYTSNNRVIIGVAIGHDGSDLLQEHVVKRHSKGYTTGKLMAFQSMEETLDDPVENYKKYALRSVASNGEIQYFVKLVNPRIDNISLDTENNLPNNPDTNYHGNSDVMTRVSIDFSITPEELVAWWGTSYGSTDGGYMNSVMLVAGRPAVVNEKGNSHNTYRDLICTNKSNFENKPIKNAKVEKFSYELYYV